MSYQPRILAKRHDLLKIENELELEQYSEDNDIRRVAKELLSVLNNFAVFEGIEIIVFHPEHTTFNALVRRRLDESGVYYVTIN